MMKAAPSFARRPIGRARVPITRPVPAARPGSGGAEICERSVCEHPDQICIIHISSRPANAPHRPRHSACAAAAAALKVFKPRPGRLAGIVGAKQSRDHAPPTGAARKDSLCAGRPAAPE